MNKKFEEETARTCCTKIQDDFVESLQAVLEELGTRAFNVRRSLGGKSSAIVYLVDIECGKHNGQAILKLSRASLAEDIRGMKVAKEHSRKLAQTIPELIYSKESDGFNVILQRVAGGGFLQADPLADTPLAILNTGFQRLSESLLQEWNGDGVFSNQYFGPEAILGEFLENRLEANGRIWKFIEDVLEIEKKQPSIDVLRETYPNPLSLLSSTSQTATKKLQVIRGFGHGDFHSENVLVRYVQQIKELFIIDFDAAKVKTPLLFDHAYLEVSHLLKLCGTRSYDDWIDVCSQLTEIEDQSDVEKKVTKNEDQGLLWTIGMLRGSIRRWQKECYPDRVDDLYKQKILARVAAGLNFSAKVSLSDDHQLSDKKKTLAFIYAASAAKRYFDFCKIPLGNDRKAISLTGVKPSPSNDDWRCIWRAADDFTPSSGAYILVASEELENLAEDLLRSLAKLPWSLVLDLSKNKTEGLFYSAASAELKLKGTFSAVFPSQSSSGHNDTDCCWLFAEPGQEGGIANWRKSVLPALRAKIKAEYQKFTPLPLYLVIFGKAAPPAKLRAVVGAAQEEAGNLLKTIVVVGDTGDKTGDSLREEIDSFDELNCEWTDFSLGVARMIGDESLRKEAVTVPVFCAETNKTRPRELAPEIASRYLTSLQIVGSNGPDIIQRTDEGDGKFYQGNLITWKELNLRHDISREGYEGEKGWLNSIRTILKENPSRSIRLSHSVGTGGTTVARRVAWELRNEFPSLILNSFNDHSVSDIEYLFHFTRLPVLVVIEASRISPTNRDRIFEGLKSRSVRFLLLDVCRDLAPQNSENSITMPDSMTNNEAKIFERCFKEFTPRVRLDELKRLTNDPSYARYRIPFFYGLIAFGKEFAKIKDFIEGTYEETPLNARRWLAFLSLISRYSQRVLPYPVFKKLVGLNGLEDTISPTEILGRGAKKAILFDGQGLAIMHPVLADELLEKHLNDKSTEATESLVISLADFSVWVIEELGNEHVRDNAVVQGILIDLFVDREFWPDSAKTQHFSPLISKIPSKEGQKRVLQLLSETFPRNAHFSNHLGRHINLTQSGAFDEAEIAIKNAIRLDPSNSIHRHALGMVYRVEASRILQEWLEPAETVLERLSRAQPLIASALELFNEAVELSDVNSYPLVTPMQMVFNLLDRILTLSKMANFGELLSDRTGVGEWSRNLLNDATILLEKLHKLEAGSPKSEHRQKCDAEYQKVLGNYGEMISGLRQLLLQPGVNKSAVRRLLVQGHLGGKGQSTLSNQRRICKLMLQNIQEDPIKEFDIRTWFRAFRETPDFTLSSAVEKFTEWSLITNIPDVHYYLHILHFMQSKLDIRASQRESLEQLNLMRQNLNGLISKRSFEWLGRSKETGQLTLVSHMMLGEWDSAAGFFKNSDLLSRVPATVSKISSPQAGKVDIGGVEAFFVPRSEFISPHDLNAKVECFVGFSYEGPRAWRVLPRP